MSATTSTLRYSLANINSIAHKGFDYEIPENVMDLITSIALKVGHTGSIASPIFKKRDPSEEVFTKQHNSNNSNNSNYTNNRKKKGNRAAEISDAEWESLRTFQPTKLSEKSGIDIHIGNIRDSLNKLTDKLYDKLKGDIFNTVNQVMAESYSEEDMAKLGKIIFERCTDNKTYSKVYAQIYKELADSFPFLRQAFNTSYSTFKSLFDNIEFVEPEVNYDKFCENNANNNKRRSLSQFLVNLSLNGFLDKVEIIKLLKHLLESILDLIHKDGNKPIVDEITENVAILYNTDIMNDVDLDDDELTIDNDNVSEVIKTIAIMKAKDYKSLTSKSVFKFMDLSEL